MIFGDKLPKVWEQIVGYKREEPEPVVEEKQEQRRPVLVESRLAS